MRKLVILGGMLVFAAASHAAVIASWDYESINGVAATDGQTLTANDLVTINDGDYIDDTSGNGNHLYNYFNGGYGVAQNIGGNTTLAGYRTGSFGGTQTDGDLQLGGSAVGALAMWSIEADVYFNGTGGYQTLVGKDGINLGGDANAAALYLQKVDTGAFRINFATASGDRFILDGSTLASASSWYNVKATSDGATLRLYVNGALENTLDISGATDSSLVALQTGEVEGASGPKYGWTVGRGMYGDGHGDRVDGYVDNVVITNIPEPATLGLIGIAGAGLLFARRRFMI